MTQPALHSTPAVRAVLVEQIRAVALTLRLPAIAHRCVVEMKYRDSVPALLRRLVEDCALDPTAVSKYRLSVAALGLAEAESASLAGSGLEFASTRYS